MAREAMSRQMSSSQASVNSRIPCAEPRSPPGGRPLAASARGTVTRTVSKISAGCGRDAGPAGRMLSRKCPPRPTQASDVKETKDGVMVAVRFRPMSKKERARGDSVLWQVDPSNTVGLVVRGTFKPKFNYDTVLRDTADNREVYNSVAASVVETAMNGINGTIFAYGVTSSGKTHTMMGNEAQPGIVPQSICQVFEMIESMPSKEFLLRLSVMEIYNEVLNDLLDPSHGNLKIREHRVRGVHIEGLKEEVVLSAEHALSLIARGEANRKVSCTAFNEDSSRSHIICRLSIEASDRIPDNEERAPVARTLSYLNLIDLAGSESAKAVMSRGHRREGSFINKSLLTLGTVIHKLSDKGSKGAIHIPFRDSKLTRLLQSSLSGNGAKVAIICTVTPASMQAEETHNTLKFASRAKKIEIKCTKNQIMSDKSLILRYQAEIKKLRKQIDKMAGNGNCGDSGENSALQEEICYLRNRLDEEVRWHVKQDVVKSALEAKVQRLTRLILTSTSGKATVVPAEVCTLQRSRSLEAPVSAPLEDSAFSAGLTESTKRGRRTSEEYSSAYVGSPLASTSSHRRSDSKGMSDSKIRHHNRRLKEQVELMAFVLDQRERDVSSLRAQLSSQGQKPGSPPSHVLMDETHSDVLQNSLEFVKQENARLTADLVRTKVELKRAQTETRRAAEMDRFGRPDKQLLFAPSCLSRTDSSVTETTQVELGKVSPYPDTPGSMQSSGRGSDGGQFVKHDVEMQDKVAKFDQRIQAALSDLTKKELLLGKIRSELKGMRSAKDVVEKQLRELKCENETLQTDLQKQGLQNNRLQGYLLDGMSSEELNELIIGLTQAAERVRLTVQLRRLSNVITTDHSVKCDIDNKEDTSEDCSL